MAVLKPVTTILTSHSTKRHTLRAQRLTEIHSYTLLYKKFK